jgi:hypothetical protein
LAVFFVKKQYYDPFLHTLTVFCVKTPIIFGRKIGQKYFTNHNIGPRFSGCSQDSIPQTIQKCVENFLGEIESDPIQETKSRHHPDPH